MRIVQCTDIGAYPTPAQREWVAQQIVETSADIVVCTGDLITAERETDLDAAYGEIASWGAALPVDVLYLPGDRDRRERFVGSFGRRYRIDTHDGTTPGFLDRTVRVDGSTLVLMDITTEDVDPFQLRWLRSVLDSVGAAAERGAILATVPIFTHRPLDETAETAEFATVFSDTLRRYRSLKLAVFSGHVETERVAIIGDVPNHTIPAGVPAIRVIDTATGNGIESVTVYSTKWDADAGG